MAYQVLARAYRPRSFAEMVGQEHVVKPLKNALMAERLHHAYLFCGTRGTGKTTVARVFAKALNCLNLTEGEPCNTCENCTEIDTGRFVDLLEIDAASRTKVEDTRDLLDNVAYMPAKGRFKIYLIDEVHMLSTHSFNALLKTLEEPPEHVKFLLCTTDPQKCPVTVLSRCLQFYLRHLTREEIHGHMTYVLTQQSLSFDTEALQLIADAAKGSMRDALSLLDQAISFGAGAVRKQDVLDMMGAIDPDAVLDLLEYIIRRDIRGALQFLHQFESKSDAYDHLCASLIQAIHGLAMMQMLPQDRLEESAIRQTQFKKMKDLIAPQELQLLYQFALMGQRDLALAPHPQYGFEMLLLRMIAFIPLTIPSEVQQALSVAPSVPLAKASPAPPAGTPVNAPSTQPVAPLTGPMASSTAFPIPAVHEKWVGLSGGERVNLWREMIEALSLSGIAKQIILHSELVSFADHVLTLSLPKQYQTLLTDPLKNQIEQALRKSFSPTCQLKVGVAEKEVASPMKKRAEEHEIFQEQANRTIRDDEHVRFLQQMGATIVPGSVKARAEKSMKQKEEH